MADVGATEHQLSELLSNGTGSTGTYDLIVRSSKILEYSYNWKGKQVTTQKLEVELQSLNPSQYCLGAAKLLAGDKRELKELCEKFKKSTTWKCSNVKLVTEKPAFIHTACRIVIDLRKSHWTVVLQSAKFPKAPTPTCSIADILQLKQMQRFDLLAIVTKILDERRPSVGSIIADVRLVDDSKDPRDTATEPANASIPITLFFTNEEQFSTFKESIGAKPLLFMCLSGDRGKDGKVVVRTLKDLSWWEPGAGEKHDHLMSIASTLPDVRVSDVAGLHLFQGQDAADYANVTATLSACIFMDPPSANLIEAGHESLFQLNHIYVPPPQKGDSIKAKNGTRLFVKLAMAGFLETQQKEYEEHVESGELRHSILSSLRVRVKKSPAADSPPSTFFAQGSQGTDSPPATEQINAMVVEAQACTLEHIPNDSVQAIQDVLGGMPQTSDRIATVTLQQLQVSPFYSMLTDLEPVDKALVLLKYNQRSSGKNLGDGFRIVTENVQDAMDDTNQKRYGTIALCSVEKSPDFIAQKDSVAICVISKVTSPLNPYSGKTADLYVEAMEVVPASDTQRAIEMMSKLQTASSIKHGNTEVSDEQAWRQKKCRRLTKYPTMT